MRKYKILYLFIFIFILSGCGSGGGGSSAPKGNEQQMDELAVDEPYNGYVDDGYVESEEQDPLSKESLDTNAEPKEEEKKRIILGEIKIEVEDLNSTKGSVENITEASGGYIESLSLSEHGRSKNFDATLKIPAVKYKEVKEQIQKLGYVSYITESEEDITRDYYSVKTELELKELEVKTLEELLLQAQGIEEIIMLERKLSVVRASVNSNKYKLQNMDLVTSYSTLHVSITEVNYKVELNSELTGFGKRFKNAVMRSVSSTTLVVQWILLLLAAYIIPLTFIAIIIFIVYKVIKKFTNKKSKQKKEMKK